MLLSENYGKEATECAMKYAAIGRELHSRVLVQGGHCLFRV